MTIKIAHNEAVGLGIWSLAVFLVIIFGPILNYLYNSFQTKLKTAPSDN